MITIVIVRAAGKGKNMQQTHPVWKRTALSILYFPGWITLLSGYSTFKRLGEKHPGRTNDPFCTSAFTIAEVKVPHIAHSGDQELLKRRMRAAVFTLGEGWHNNHHYFPSAVKQLFYKAERDPTDRVLKIMQRFGLVTAMKESVPQKPR